ncbi:hypothetical protein SORBI_3003G387200 [Sorghum bicolor]|uniref:Uncharacterized protein n=1 Tax=Sorghum bicolor TaxID=4558 RepID=A0A1B6Q7J8_SORBI|nr:hypothetical protein SORBI_3003G387200 [Sorghum bicolor]
MSTVALPAPCCLGRVGNRALVRPAEDEDALGCKAETWRGRKENHGPGRRPGTYTTQRTTPRDQSGHARLYINVRQPLPVCVQSRAQHTHRTHFVRRSREGRNLLRHVQRAEAAARTYQQQSRQEKSSVSHGPPCNNARRRRLPRRRRGAEPGGAVRGRREAGAAEPGRGVGVRGLGVQADGDAPAGAKRGRRRPLNTSTYVRCGRS